MINLKSATHLAAIVLLLGANVSSGCQSMQKRSFTHNISSVENSLIANIIAEGPGDRYVINRVNISEEVVDWFTISLTLGSSYAAASESGSTTVGAGSVVQFCGRGEFLGLPIFTEYPYLCKRGDGLVFGVTDYGWVHLYGTGEIADKWISLKKPN
ncbi:MAG: hypothetical protein LJE92_17395 [Gammaproteobacteria bacterium]|jgi:hypothetical protein|nr:hypothetical protein [Gammaproteobacteria bacterium]